MGGRGGVDGWPGGRRTGKRTGPETGRAGREEDRKGGREDDRAEGREEGVFRQVFGTGTNPTGTPVAFRRGEGVFCTVSIRSFIDDYAGLRHSDPTHRYLSGILAWRSIIQPVSNRSFPDDLADPSARGPCPQVPQCHLGVAKGACGRSSARRPCPQVLQRHSGVAKGASDRSSPRSPNPQVPQWHSRVAKHHSTGLEPVFSR